MRRLMRICTCAAALCLATANGQVGPSGGTGGGATGISGWVNEQVDGFPVFNYSASIVPETRSWESPGSEGNDYQSGNYSDSNWQLQWSATPTAASAHATGHVDNTWTTGTESIIASCTADGQDKWQWIWRGTDPQLTGPVDFGGSVSVSWTVQVNGLVGADTSWFGAPATCSADAGVSCGRTVSDPFDYDLDPQPSYKLDGNADNSTGNAVSNVSVGLLNVGSVMKLLGVNVQYAGDSGPSTSLSFLTTCKVTGATETIAPISIQAPGAFTYGWSNSAEASINAFTDGNTASVDALANVRGSVSMGVIPTYVDHHAEIDP